MLRSYNYLYRPAAALIRYPRRMHRAIASNRHGKYHSSIAAIRSHLMKEKRFYEKEQHKKELHLKGMGRVMR